MPDIPEELLKKILPPGTIVASTVSEHSIEGCRATVSRAMFGIRESYLVAIVDARGRISLRGPGRSEPSESILNLLVGQHRAMLLARNRENS